MLGKQLTKSIVVVSLISLSNLRRGHRMHPDALSLQNNRPFDQCLAGLLNLFLRCRYLIANVLNLPFQLSDLFSVGCNFGGLSLDYPLNLQGIAAAQGQHDVGNVADVSYCQSCENHDHSESRHARSGDAISDDQPCNLKESDDYDAGPQVNQLIRDHIPHPDFDLLIDAIVFLAILLFTFEVVIR
ncbi:MAG TPA: hypothetical protein VNU74_02980 [Terriglobales bacterium]|jgi:hypothetical protein|nr:hypothetical protein [Terriglobales bacterium]